MEGEGDKKGGDRINSLNFGRGMRCYATPSTSLTILINTVAKGGAGRQECVMPRESKLRGQHWLSPVVRAQLGGRDRGARRVGATAYLV